MNTISYVYKFRKLPTKYVFAFWSFIFYLICKLDEIGIKTKNRWQIFVGRNLGESCPHYWG